MINYNTCYYSEGTKHELCTHQNYCILNKYRIQLETNITELENKLSELLNMQQGIAKGEKHYNIDYNSIKKEIKILRTDLNKLTKFRENIIKNKEDNTYGY